MILNPIYVVLAVKLDEQSAKDLCIIYYLLAYTVGTV